MFGFVWVLFIAVVCEFVVVCVRVGLLLLFAGIVVVGVYCIGLAVVLRWLVLCCVIRFVFVVCCLLWCIVVFVVCGFACCLRLIVLVWMCCLCLCDFGLAGVLVG